MKWCLWSQQTQQSEQVWGALDMNVWRRRLWGNLRKKWWGDFQAAGSQRLGNMGILGGCRNTAEQESRLVHPPSACLPSLTFFQPLSGLVYWIHAVELSKQEGLLTVAQNCTRGKKKKHISWISLIGSVKIYRQDVVWCFFPLLWSSWRFCLLLCFCLFLPLIWR